MNNNNDLTRNVQITHARMGRTGSLTCGPIGGTTNIKYTDFKVYFCKILLSHLHNGIILSTFIAYYAVLFNSKGEKPR